MSPASRETTRTQPTQVPSEVFVVSALSSGSDSVAKGYVNEVPAQFLIDTGSAVTVISNELWEKSKRGGAQLRPNTGQKLANASGDFLQLRGRADIHFSLEGVTFTTEALIADSLTTDVVLGRNFLRAEECTIEMKRPNDVLHFHKSGIVVELSGGDSESELVSSHAENVPPATQELEVKEQLEDEDSCNRLAEDGKQGQSDALVTQVGVKDTCQICLPKVLPNSKPQALQDAGVKRQAAGTPKLNLKEWPLQTDAYPTGCKDRMTPLTTNVRNAKYTVWDPGGLNEFGTNSQKEGSNVTERGL